MNPYLLSNAVSMHISVRLYFSFLAMCLMPSLFRKKTCHVLLVFRVYRKVIWYNHEVLKCFKYFVFIKGDWYLVIVVLILDKQVNNNIKYPWFIFSWRFLFCCYNKRVSTFYRSVPQHYVSTVAFCCGVKVEHGSILYLPDRDIQVQVAKSANMVAYSWLLLVI